MAKNAKYVVEFIGTFLFVLVIVGAVHNTTSALAPLAIGAALMVNVYAGGHISGGHFNPAVSLAAYVRGRLDVTDLPIYWIAVMVHVWAIPDRVVPPAEDEGEQY